MRKLSVFAIAVTVAFAGTPAAWAAGDAAKGKRVFNKCKACHSLKAGKKKISKALKKSGITWDEENLSKYLKNPRKFIKGNRMGFPGLKKDSDRENLIAYLKQATKKK